MGNDGSSPGTMDLSDRTAKRQNGVSVSSWNRPLITGDFKDSEITDVSKKVLFAYGKDDWFTYHGKDQQTSCDINFFTEETNCANAPPADTWVCSVCAHEYDAEEDGNGAAFETLPETWLCPVCGQPKAVYKKKPESNLMPLV